MMVDTDMQVWLDTTNSTRPGVIVPYVVSDHPRDIRYRLRAVQAGDGGRAVIGQTGAVRLSANVPTPLSTLSLVRRTGDHCEIEVTLTGSDLSQRRYVFDCSS